MIVDSRPMTTESTADGKRICWPGSRPSAGRRSVNRAKAGGSPPPSCRPGRERAAAVAADGGHSRQRAGLRGRGSGPCWRPGSTAGRGRVPVGPTSTEPRWAARESEGLGARNRPESEFPRPELATRPSPGYHPGAAPLSEPETACFAALVDRIQPRAVVTVHAPFACINHDGPAAAWAAAVAAACGWPAQADIGYPTPGSLGSWLGVERGVPVLTIELPPGAYEGFREQARRALAAAVRGPS